MDIFKYVKSINYGADYYDYYTGYIYGIVEYGRAKKFGLPNMGIPVYENGKLIGFVHEDE